VSDLTQGALRTRSDNHLSKKTKSRGVVMLETMVEWAGQPGTAWSVLGCAAFVIFFQALRTPPDAMWSDMFEEDD
jgi:hypothetical protein